ncbi:MAG: hypothetical protein FWD36_09275 [Treponema sp.]|nr:hypothetical protein [Treponema sp.]
MDEKTRENNRLRQRKFLELHKDEINEKRRERYQERLSLGKCPRCGGKSKKGRNLCTACCEYMLELNRKYAQEKKGTVKSTKKAAAKPATKAKVAPKKAAAKPKAKAKTAAKPKAKAAAKPKAKAKTTTKRPKKK